MPPSRANSEPSRSQRTAAIHLLLAAVRGDLDDEWGEAMLRRAGTAAVLEAATYHGLSGLLFHHLRDRRWVEGDLIEPLRERYEGAVRQHVHAVWELAKVAGTLDDLGSPWTAIKGPIVAELAYDDPGHRTYRDLDLLVHPAAFGRALEALQAEGARLLDRNWRTIRTEMRGELHLLSPRRMPLDLHWTLVNMYRGRIRLDVDGILERTERIDLGPHRVPALERTDAVIHLALHATLSGGDRLVWMVDLANTLARRPPDWDDLVRRAHAWHAAAPVGLMLSRATSTLGAAVPSEITNELLGRRQRALIAGVERISPWQSARGRILTPSLTLTRSMGFGMLGSLGWLIGRGLKSLDPREPDASSAFTPRGTEADRAEYLAAVSAIGESS